MKLLIIDDEPKIRRGLYRHFMAGEFRFEAIETAENAYSAFVKARKLQPDIILADICMPGMSGLEFIEQISLEMGHVRTIVISGHDDFAYAQQAIRCGVRDYVLKPIDLEKLDALLERVCRDIRAQNQQAQHVAFALNYVDRSKATLISDLCNKIIRQEIGKDAMEREAALVGVTIPNPAGLLMIRAVSKSPDDAGEWDMELLSYAIENIANEICSKIEGRLFFTDSRNNTLMLFPYHVQIDYAQMQDELCRAMEICLGYEIRADFALVADTYAQLPGAYKEMYRRLSHVNEYSQIVIDAKNYIERNYFREDLTLSAVADAIQASASYLSRLMQRQLGMSFVDYLTDYRMKKAAVLLDSYEKDIKLYEISQKLGFSSQHYFSRVFTRHYGMSPMQYRMRGGGKH